MTSESIAHSVFGLMGYQTQSPFGLEEEINIPSWLKNKKETYSHTPTKLLLRRAINLEKKGIYFCEILSTFMASRRDDDVTTAFIERFHWRDQNLWKKWKESNSYRISREHQHGRRFIVLEHQHGSHDVMWKRSITSRVVWSLVWNVIQHFAPPLTGNKARETLLPPAEWSEDPDNISDYAIDVWEPAVN